MSGDLYELWERIAIKIDSGVELSPSENNELNTWLREQELEKNGRKQGSKLSTGV